VKTRERRTFQVEMTSRPATLTVEAARAAVIMYVDVGKRLR
jgi:hypothetical protein